MTREDEARTRFVIARVTTEEWRGLRVYAAQLDLTVSELIRRILAEHTPVVFFDPRDRHSEQIPHSTESSRTWTPKTTN